MSSGGAASIFAVLALPVLAACAAMVDPAEPAEMVVDCEVLQEDSLHAVTVAESALPRLTNEAEVRERLEWLVLEREGLRTRVRLLIQPEGHASHGCVVEGSGNQDFDRAVLEAAREARFAPATDGGERVPAWLMIWLGLD